VNLSHRVPPGADRRVQLMATCLCDAFFDDAAAATVQLLEHLGCKVEFPEGQTCCGQPAFNGGDWAASRKVVRHAVKTFAGDAPVVVPSGSCAAMMFHGAILEFEKEADLPVIVNGLGVKQWPGRFEGTIAFHRSCHTRGTPSSEAALTLLRSVEGLKIAEFGEGEQCCGFGGTFAVTFPHVSQAMGNLKLDHVLEARPDLLVSGDMSCLMHMSGLAAKGGRPIKVIHFAQLLRDALKNGGLLTAN
jgi:L-lactate dehydrogenase complex protein LldE